MKHIVIMLAALAMNGCVNTAPYVNVAGHPYKTDPSCKRTQPLGKFDLKCDCPTVGYRGSCTQVATLGYMPTQADR